MFTIVINWKTVAAVGVSVIGTILAIKVEKNDAKDALSHLADVVFAPTKKVIDNVED